MFWYKPTIISIILGLLTASAYAEVGVIIKNNGVIVSKEVYAGDTSSILPRLIERKKSDPSFLFDIYDLTVKVEQDVFVNIQIPKTREQLETLNALQTLKDPAKTDAEFRAAIIKYLGL